jgi:anti-sigma B factor antagonist
LVVRTVGDIAVVYFTDSKLVDEMQIKWLGAELYDLVDKKGKSRIVVNFQDVQRLSTALLGKLVGLQKKTAKAKGNVRLCCVPSSVRDIFTVTGLDTAFEIHGNEKAAIQSFDRISG